MPERWEGVGKKVRKKFAIPWERGFATCRSLFLVPLPTWSRGFFSQESFGKPTVCCCWWSRWKHPVCHVEATIKPEVSMGEQLQWNRKWAGWTFRGRGAAKTYILGHTPQAIQKCLCNLVLFPEAGAFVVLVLSRNPSDAFLITQNNKIVKKVSALSSSTNVIIVIGEWVPDKLFQSSLSV